MSTPKVNEECWCGSGKKYKKCHMHRSLQSPVGIQEWKEQKKAHFSKKYCLHPESNIAGRCQGSIVKAHTIQRNGGLSKIAVNGQVYGLSKRVPKDVSDVFSFSKIGIRQASTFTGFCGYHDNQIFEPIENYPFQSNGEHAFLLAYRAICKELFDKKSAYELSNVMKTMDAGMNPLEQAEFQLNIDEYRLGVKAAIRDAQEYKSEYDSLLLARNFADVNFYVLRTDSCPEFLCSGASTPSYDFRGNSIQELGQLDVKMVHTTFSVIPIDNGGAIVFSWIGKNKIEQLIQSLHSYADDQLPHAILRFAFDHFENVFLSPIWWDSLDDRSKEGIRRHMSEGIFTTRNALSLLDDGLRAVSWKIVARETNLAL